MMDAQKVFLVLLDISGYTRFIRFHRLSLLHAERIIDELLECAIAEMDRPLVLQEIEGDAVYLYAISDGSREMARNIGLQVQRSLAAFKAREAELVSEASLCVCDACKAVGRLRMKAVLHHGEAVFTRVQQFNKVSGEDVILVHRLLKTSIESKEYVLLTENMHVLLGDLDGWIQDVRIEDCEELGDVKVNVYYPAGTEPQRAAPQATLLAKLKMLLIVMGHSVMRSVVPASKHYRNLEDVRRPAIQVEAVSH